MKNGIEVVWVKVDDGLPIKFYAVGNLELQIGDEVVVEDYIGELLGKVVKGPAYIDPDAMHMPLEEITPVLRKATEEDYKRLKENEELEEEAFKFCKERIEHRELPMKLVKVKASLDRRRIMFFFTSDRRVDFRALVKDLARKYRTRIEMRQIGIRDEAKMIGGIGPCGQVICCKQFLNKFHSVSVRMAKEQYLMLNPSKISGLCGRLMCCLSYEYPIYQELAKEFPKVGEKVRTTTGIEGEVISANIIDRKVILSLGEGKGQVTVPVEEVISEKGGKE
ncbi:conserved hypothetical protein [Thermosulfidibacter takaii ABI70S6]|uniref:PSP1 C-terminal domain-containing protein n=1 Tax=Thermosulfidibacter takaii (strain DSM 17441 / JCM 13301 / NBRC 103674 / ABI70S6) TaxID=1298851 RepID=A0A0S3QSC0_THET7|nr:regulatory iron-sulfur-containing complex subunit RicT [Thermosulfidibacter takaii]BAT71235.1 conserved hypothetical protein [Thermosulfidibacter takaii ABI70S6]